MGQILLARRMGKTRIIAETGAGQHGVATATVCALFGLPCTVYMGATDVERQKPNVFRMKLLGAEVIPVTSGAGTLKDAMNEAMRDWVANVADTYYLIGTVAGPHPYPAMVRDFQSVIGTEAKPRQMQEAEGRLPDAVVAAIGGGSNAMGLFHPFLDDVDVRLIGVEAAGRGLDTNAHAASLSAAAGPACCTATAPICCRTRTARSPRRTASAPGSTIPASARNIPGCTRSAASNTWPPPTRRRWRPSSSAPARRASSPLWSRRTHWPMSRRSPRRWARTEDRADEHVRPRRQGHLHRRRAPGREAVSRIAGPVRRIAAAEGRGALIPFLEAYDPDLATSMAILHGMPGAGADLIEIGMPFTDPMADGPTVQAAGHARLAAGATLARTLAMVRRNFREDDATPIDADGLPEPHPLLRHRALLRRCGQGRGRMG